MTLSESRDSSPAPRRHSELAGSWGKGPAYDRGTHKRPKKIEKVCVMQRRPLCVFMHDLLMQFGAMQEGESIGESGKEKAVGRN